MAVEREKFNDFSLGIQETGEFSDQSLLNSFLNDEPLEEIKEEEKKAPPKQEQKAPIKDPPSKEKEKAKEEEEFDFNKALFAKEEGKQDEDEEKEDTDKETEEEDAPEVNQFEILSKELYKIGTFIHEGEGEAPVAKTPEEFKGLFESQIQNKATKWLDGFLGRFGDGYKELFEAVFVNGVDPSDYLPVYSELESLDGIDLADDTNQEIVVREYYSRLGWDKNQIDKKIQKLKDYADLEEEATNVHAKLIDDNKTKLAAMEEDRKKQALRIRQQDDEYKANINKVLVEKVKAKEFDGIPLSEDTARKAFDFLYAKKWKSGSQELTDFDKFIIDSKKDIPTRIKIALLAINNFDFSKIEKKAVSKESSEIFSELVSKTTKKKQSPSVQKTSAWLNL